MQANLRAASLRAFTGLSSSHVTWDTVLETQIKVCAINLGDIFKRGAKLQLLGNWAQVIVNTTMICINMSVYYLFLLLILQALLVSVTWLP